MWLILGNSHIGVYSDVTIKLKFIIVLVNMREAVI